MSAILRSGLAAAAALGIAAVLALTPLLTPLFWPGLRLDALAGAWLLLSCVSLIGLAGATDQPLWAGLAEHLALAVIASALDLRLAALGCLVLGLFGGWRTLAAGGMAAFALAWLGASAGHWQWNDATLGAFLNSPQVGLLLVGGGLQLGLLGGWPAERRLLFKRSAAPVSAAGALAGLYLLLRLYELGPLNWGWTLAGAFAGGAAMIWHAVQGLGAASAVERRSGLERAWWHAAFATALLASEAGIAATWTLALIALLAASALQPPSPSASAGLALGALPLTLPFAGLWLALAAAQAGGLPVLAAVFWLTGVLLTAGTGRLLVESAESLLPRRRRWLPPLLSVGLALLLPLALIRLITPTFGQLGAGLTPFGRPLLQPWTGMLVRDAGSATVAVLPGLVLGGLLLLVCALAYLMFRLLGRQMGQDGPPRPRRLAARQLWQMVRRNLPTAPTAPAEDEQRDL